VTALPFEVASADWISTITPFLRTHCLECHSGPTSEGGLDLTTLSSDLSDVGVLQRWVRIHDRIAKGEMPPKDSARLPTTEKEALLSSLSDILRPADAPHRQTSPRRLNRVEYENTICDLFQIRIDLQSMLPEDQQVQGFDTVGEGLEISSEQIEVYLLAADAAIDKALGPARAPKPVDVTKPLALDKFASRGIGGIFRKTDDNGIITFNRYRGGPVFLEGQSTGEGTYRLRVKAKPFETDLPVIMAIYAGDVIVGRHPKHHVGYYDIQPGNEWTTIELEDYLTPGSCFQFTAYNLNTPLTGARKMIGGGMIVGEVSVQGPLEPWPPISRSRLLGHVDPDHGTVDDARDILTRFLPRAFRRPVSSDEIEFYVSFAKQTLDAGRPFLDALRVSLQGVLSSPEFLFLQLPLEAAPVPRSEAQQFALASRLSYFLWSSSPDEALFSLAQSGELAKPEVLKQETERMLRDPKSERFVENFTGQWLKLRSIDETEPDKRLFPEFDESLRYAMVEESRLFFREMLEQDRPVQEFVDSDWAILNERLADHYQIDGVHGQAFRHVLLPKGSLRGGVITQASVLKVTSNGTNTSPVVRGNWVLNNILGEKIPPPPPNVGAIDPDIRGATTIREQLDLHRNVASCMSCHQHLDPPGFALEGLDPIGLSRDWYRVLGGGKPLNLRRNGRRVEYQQGLSVDDSGHLPDGQNFKGIAEFKKLLLENPSQVTRCLTDKLLIYSLGRELGFSDRDARDVIVSRAGRHQDGFRSLIHEVIQSELFRAY